MSLPGLQEFCGSILAEGKRWHGLAVGIVSRIRDHSYEVIAADSDTGIPQMGDIFALAGTYCLAVVDGRASVAITEIGGMPGMCLHPLYRDIPCEAYISSPILVDEQVWGTLNYTSFDIRETPFSSRDIDFNETQARQIAATIARLGR
ncbi:MAG: GAF domain-containing protein [Gammaproteobacteria bacterium]|nr:GAF domain-containing protein [Gammaproteobacteria bacterium]